MPTATATQSPATTTLTAAQWASDVIVYLNALGGYNIPNTPANQKLIQTWMAAEGGPQSNPLNTSFNSFPIAANDATTFSSAGFPEYATPDLAAEATARTLIDGKTTYKYAPIIASLEQSASLPVFTQAVVNSSWDANHYAGTGFAAGTVQPYTGNITGGAGDTGQANPESDLPIPGALGWTTELGTLLGDLTSTTWWKRVGVFTLGAALFVVGLAGFIATTKEGQKVVSEGTSAATLAAVA